MTFQLYPHQQHALDRVAEAVELGINQVIIVHPTGAGKTCTAVHACEQQLARFGDDAQALIVSHREELIEQAASEYMTFFPDVLVGIYRGSQRETETRVISASIMSCYGDKICDETGRVVQEGRLSELPLANIKVLFIDEAHHAAAETYLQLVRAWREVNPDGVLIGVTATPARADGKTLSDLWNARWYEFNGTRMLKVGKDSEDDERPRLIMPEEWEGRVRGLYVDILTLKDGWEQKFLCRLRNDCVERVEIEQLDLTDVKTSAKSKDFVGRALAKKMDRPEIHQIVIDTWWEMMGPGVAPAWCGHLGRLTIAFCSSVKAARTLAEMFTKDSRAQQHGIKAVCIDGAMKKRDRKRAHEDFAADEHVRLLTSCNALIEGFNVKHITGGLFVRPTKSSSIWIQILGRILRKAPGKLDALAVDFVGAVDAGLVSLADLDVLEVDGVDEEGDEEEIANENKPADEVEDDALGDAPDTIERRPNLGTNRFTIDVYGGMVHFALLGNARVCPARKGLVVIIFPDKKQISGFRAIGYDTSTHTYMQLSGFEHADERAVLRRASAFVCTWGKKDYYRPGPWFTGKEASDKVRRLVDMWLERNAAVSRRPLGFDLPNKLTMSMAFALAGFLQARWGFAAKKAVQVEDLFGKGERTKKVRKARKTRKK